MFGPEQTVADAVVCMAERQVGAVPIIASGRLVGIFSERDLLRRVIAQGRVPEETLLSDVMTPHPVTALPDESRLLAIDKMRDVGCRHLPVEVDGEVIDMLSMRDLLYAEIEEKSAQVEELRHYVSGSY
jgi:CBS domain-containing protein